MGPRECVRSIKTRARAKFRHRHRHKRLIVTPSASWRETLWFRVQRCLSSKSLPISLAIAIVVLISLLAAITTEAFAQSTKNARPAPTQTRQPWSANGGQRRVQVSNDSFQTLPSESKRRATHFKHPLPVEPVVQMWPASLGRQQEVELTPMRQPKKAAGGLGARGRRARGRTFQEAGSGRQQGRRKLATTPPPPPRWEAAAQMGGDGGGSLGPMEQVSEALQPRRRQRSNQMTSAITAEMNRKCALILQRTYVRKLTAANEIESESLDQDMVPVEPTGRMEQVCLTYDDVNKAIEEAKRLRAFKLTNELMEAVESIEPLPPFIAQLGELNQEVTKILTAKFDLSPDEILNGLPLIDMSRTNFWPICPLMVKPIQCDSTGRFRSFTGHCNNLNNPIWGAAQTPFVRYLAPKHPDGIEQDRVSALDASPLPAPRLVTSRVHRDVDRPSSDLSLLIMVWGQFVDHDVAQAAPPRSKYRTTKLHLSANHPNSSRVASRRFF